MAEDDSKPPSWPRPSISLGEQRRDASPLSGKTLQVVPQGHWPQLHFFMALQNCRHPQSLRVFLIQRGILEPSGTTDKTIRNIVERKVLHRVQEPKDELPLGTQGTVSEGKAPGWISSSTSSFCYP